LISENNLSLAKTINVQRQNLNKLQQLVKDLLFCATPKTFFSSSLNLRHNKLECWSLSHICREVQEPTHSVEYRKVLHLGGLQQLPQILPELELEEI